MIETKEQYLAAQYLAMLKADGLHGVEYAIIEDLIETIEALREVAKIAQFAKYMAASHLDKALNKQLEKLRFVLENIPNWIIEDDKQVIQS